MSKSRFTVLLLLISLLLATAAHGQNTANVAAVQPVTVLQLGVPIERALSSNQVHNYTINLAEDSFMQLIVEQRGIDVVVRAFSPSGKRLGEFDSPNGGSGPENVTVVAVTAGDYRIEVAPLRPPENPAPGRYEIKVIEIRKATDEELQAGQNQDQIKAKGLALLNQAAQSFQEIRHPETRAGFQIKAAQLLWESDAKRAAKLMDQAIDSIKEFLAAAEDSSDEGNYYMLYQTAMQLRQQVVEVLTPHDPETALNFLRSTRTLPSPQGIPAEQLKQELQLELTLVNAIAATDPKRAFQMAQDSLKTGSSTGMLSVVSSLRARDPDLAAKLVHEIVRKLENERLLKNTEAGYLASSLISMVRQPGKAQPNENGDNSANPEILSEDDFRTLFQKMLAELLAYTPGAPNFYSPERDVAQNLAYAIKRLSNDLQNYAPDKKAALEEKLQTLQNPDPQRAPWIKYQAAITESSTDTAIESINQAPSEMKDSLYQQLALKVLESGDFQRARQIVTERIKNPMQREQSLQTLERQAIFNLIGQGKVDEALRLLTNFRPTNERAALIGQIVNRIGPGLKRAAALGYLEQVRALLDPSPKAEDQAQMDGRLQLARALARYEPARAFDIVDPLVEQFNELCAAAAVMNGFGQKYYDDGELIRNNGNNINEIVNRLAPCLAGLAMVNFDRAKTSADRIRPIDIRVHVYMTMAQIMVQDTRGGVVDY
jgi:hypothetical protein